VRSGKTIIKDWHVIGPERPRAITSSQQSQVGTSPLMGSGLSIRVKPLRIAAGNRAATERKAFANRFCQFAARNTTRRQRPLGGRAEANGCLRRSRRRWRSSTFATAIPIAGHAKNGVESDVSILLTISGRSGGAVRKAGSGEYGWADAKYGRRGSCPLENRPLQSAVLDWESRHEPAGRQTGWPGAGTSRRARRECSQTCEAAFGEKAQRRTTDW